MTEAPAVVRHRDAEYSTGDLLRQAETIRSRAQQLCEMSVEDDLDPTSQVRIQISMLLSSTALLVSRENYNDLDLPPELEAFLNAMQELAEEVRAKIDRVKKELIKRDAKGFRKFYFQMMHDLFGFYFTRNELLQIFVDSTSDPTSAVYFGEKQCGEFFKLLETLVNETMAELGLYFDRIPVVLNKRPERSTLLAGISHAEFKAKIGPKLNP